MAFLDINEAQKKSKANKGRKGPIKGQIQKSIRFL